MAQDNTAPARFGLPILDAAFGGGIPRGSVILVEDEIGVESDLITLNFLTEGLRGGETGWVMSTEHPFKYYADNLRSLGVNADILLETERMVYIDAFSNPYGYSDMRSQFKNVVNNLIQPRAINLEPLVKQFVEQCYTLKLKKYNVEVLLIAYLQFYSQVKLYDLLYHLFKIESQVTKKMELLL
ncbi:MAG: RAD55 family ATPase [Candidatus Heimdallarchaeota archaeon]